MVDEEQNDNAVIFLKTEIIKAICRQYLGHPKRDIKGGDDNASSLILLPIEELLNPKFVFGVEREEPDVHYGNTQNDKILGYIYVLNVVLCTGPELRTSIKTVPSVWRKTL